MVKYNTQKYFRDAQLNDSPVDNRLISNGKKNRLKPNGSQIGPTPLSGSCLEAHSSLPDSRKLISDDYRSVQPVNALLKSYHKPKSMSKLGSVDLQTPAGKK